MPRALKVFRTAIGFHDAYVAAPSRKAALEAWGATADLFARGVAEQVDDPALTSEALAQPGTVIRKLRGTFDEQIAALPEPRPRPAARKSRPAREPRPSRAALDAAEAALIDAERRAAARRADIASREARLARERASVEQQSAAERERCERERDAERARYDAAMRSWEG